MRAGQHSLRAAGHCFENGDDLALPLSTAQAVELSGFAEPAPYPDQRRPAPAETSSDPLIHTLLQFMADPKAARHEIRRVQAERDRVAEYVRRHELDLDLQTLRKGSPHTLVCQKNDHSYHRALKQRGADEKLLRSLRELELG